VNHGAGITIFAPMSSKEQKFTSRRVRSSYLSVVISMTLVLFVIGVLGHLVLSARDLAKVVRENFTFTLVLDDNTSVEDATNLRNQLNLDSTTYWEMVPKSANLISKDDAAKNLQADLGEDFVDFLGFNPLSHTIDVNIMDSVVAYGDLQQVSEKYKTLDFVNDVLYDPDLIDKVNKNIEKMSWLLGGITIVLLLIALALINASIRLTIYSKRFLLKTMQLVGATSSFIRRPYIWTSVILGLISAVFSLGLLYGLGMGLAAYFPAFSAIFSVDTTIFVVVGVVLLSIVVPGISTVVAIRRYLKLRTNELYY